MDKDEQSIETALEELERSARTIARFAESLRASPDLVDSAEVLAVTTSAEQLAAEVRLADPSSHDD